MVCQMKASNKKVTVAEYIANFVTTLGVDTIPFVQGGVIMKIIDFVGQNKKLKYIASNHEQAVAMFVDGYARIKGFGVGMATSGPGGTNMATGIACAYYDSIPCLFVTGQVGMFHVKGNKHVRQRGFQETDIVSMMAPITKYAVMLEKAEDVRYIFEKAVYLAKSGRPGPVLIDVPYNVQREFVDPGTLHAFNPDVEGEKISPVSSSDVDEIVKELSRAIRPVLLMGGGVRIADQAKTALALADLLKIPIISTWGAVDIFPSTYPLYLGTPGRYGNISANDIALKSDLVLALGARFSTKVVYNDKIFAKDTKVIAIDVDRGELEEGLLTHYKTIVADLRDFMPRFITKMKGLRTSSSERTSWQNEAKKLKSESFEINVPPPSDVKNHVSPYALLGALSEVLGTEDIITSDCGLNLVWSVQGYKSKGGNQRFLSAWGNSPMGYSFPAAIGVHFARPRALSVCLIGDGGMQMNIQELQTVFKNKVPIKIFILNNYCYGMMMLNKPEFNGRTYGNNPETGYEAPDFVAVAKAYKIKSVFLKNDKNIEVSVKKILAMKGPVLINVNLHPDQNIYDAVIAAKQSPPPKTK